MRSSREIDAVVASCRVLGRKKTSLSHVNEDWKHIGRDNLYIIADGLSNPRGGQMASWLASESIVKGLSELISGLRRELYTDDDILLEMERVMKSVNQNIMLPLSAMSKSYRGFGTTLDTTFLHNSRAYICHVGDSKVFLYRNQQLSQITDDDSCPDSGEESLSGDERMVASMRWPIAQYMGKPDMAVHNYDLDVWPGDRLLMATDGMTDCVHPSEISEILATNDVRSAMPKLVYRANYPQKMAKIVAEYYDIPLRNAKHILGGKDNITAILIEVRGNN